jgi:hypothetical protein
MGGRLRAASLPRHLWLFALVLEGHGQHSGTISGALAGFAKLLRSTLVKGKGWARCRNCAPSRPEGREAGGDSSFVA